MLKAVLATPTGSRRIGLVTYSMLGGGMEVTLLRLARGLRTAGWAPEFVTTVSTGDWVPRIREAGFTHVSLFRPDGAFDFGAAHAERVGRFLRSAGYRALLLNHAQYAQATLGMLPQDVVAVPVLHNDMDDMYRVGLANPEGWNVAIAVSDRVRTEAARRLPWHEIRTIPNGVEVPVELPARVPSPSFRVVFAGRLEHAQKGVLLLPEIVRRVLEDGIDVRVEVLGDGPDRQALQRRLAAEGLSDRVLLRGMVEQKEVQSAFARADAMLMPSYFEGQGLTMIEAMAQGCVPVVSNLPGVTDTVIESGRSGLFASPGDPAGFAARLMRLARDGEERRRMSAAARERILQHFSFESMLAGYVGVLEDGLSGRLPTPVPRHRLPRVNPTVLNPGDFVPAAVRTFGRRLFAR